MQYTFLSNDPLATRLYTLQNGLKVYLSSYKYEPRIYTNIVVKAGSKHDPPDATGLAHYLEHMLFKGTDLFGTNNYKKEKPLLDKIEKLYESYRQFDSNETDKKKLLWKEIDSVSSLAAKYANPNEYDIMLSSIGAKGTNAYTSNEKTVYVNDIPSNQFEKWLKIESERFRNPVFRLFHTELETVYEEKNRSLDDDSTRLFQELLNLLFPNHQYGQNSTIGKVTHLKHPSIKKIKDFYNKYYIPNNMAICLSGDFEYDDTIKLIQKYFGSFSPKKTPVFQVIKEQPIKIPIKKEIYGPDAEKVYLGFRFDGASSKNIPLLKMVDMILSNSIAGLIDLNLNQKQKIIKGGSFPLIMKDYSLHVLFAKPVKNQTLEQVKDLLLSQIEEIKLGNFPNWLIDAIINDLKMENIKRYEKNNSRCNEFVEAFTLDLTWKKFQSQISDLEKLTKDMIVNFAKENYFNNYVFVCKKKGKKEDSKIKKPKITPLEINRDQRSDFVNRILDEKVQDIKPKFIDFNESIQKIKIGDIQLFYKKNIDNNRFKMIYVFDLGLKHNPLLKFSTDYLKYLGTSSFSAKEKQENLYKLGCDFSIKHTEEKTFISISGLKLNFFSIFKLIEKIFLDVIFDDKTMDSFKKQVILNRRNDKLNKSKILFHAMLNYGKSEKNSSFLNQLSENDIQAFSSKSLTKIIKDLFFFKHRVLYYGANSLNELKDIINKTKHTHNLNKLPSLKNTKETKKNKSYVFIVDYDMKQAEILILARSQKFNSHEIPIIYLHNEYFGGGMSSIVFQEIRESKALAYSVFSTYSIPNVKDKYHYSISYIGTQVDKLNEGISEMLKLLYNVPKSLANFNSSVDSIVNRIRSERISKENVLLEYERLNSLDLHCDIRKNIFENISKFKIEDLKKFHDNNVLQKHYDIMILGKIDKINKKELKKYGEIKVLTLENVFGY